MSTGLVLAVLGLAVAVFLFLRSDDERVVMPGSAPSVSDGASIEAHLLAGQKIQAIKLYREEHGVGLAEAKDAVEAIARKLPTE